MLEPGFEAVICSGENEAEGRRKVGGIGDFDYVVKGDPAELIDHLRGLAADS